MKKSICIFFAVSSITIANAQRCLEGLRTAVALDMNQIPSSAQNAFADCATKTQDDGIVVIVDYGANPKKISGFLLQKGKEFTNAGLATQTTPSQSKIDDAKALAEKLDKMSDAEKQAYAMQYAMKQMAQSRSLAPQDNIADIKLAMKTGTTLTQNLDVLVGGYRQKFLAIRMASDKELAAVPKPDYSGCPEVKGHGDIALPLCSCMHPISIAHAKKILAIVEKYNTQKIALYQSYVPQVKSICIQIDDNIAKLKYGDVFKNTQYKQMLLSAQQKAFADASMLTGVEEDVRQTGADAWAGNLNAGKTDFCQVR